MIPAIIPAAGQSRRMGQPKLILEIDGLPLISRAVRALSAGGAGPIIVITPPHSLPGVDDLQRHAETSGAICLTLLEETVDMKATILHGLQYLLDKGSTPDAFLLAPADCPDLSADVIRQVIERGLEHSNSLVVPTFAGKRGHPVLFPWRLVGAIRRLDPDQGLNTLVNAEIEILEVEVNDRGILVDLDTPEDYQRRLNSPTPNRFV